MTSTLVLVGCGAAKQPEATQAREFYTSIYFDKKREFAEAAGDEWLILSAKHRLLEPDRVIEPYDVTMDDIEDVGWWAARVGSSLLAHLDVHFQEPVEVVVLAGRDYTDSLRSVLEDLNIDAQYPFDDTHGIGEQLQWLTEETAKHIDGGVQ